MRGLVRLLGSLRDYGKEGFFDCNASKEAIGLEMPAIRDIAQVPSKLELSSIQIIINFQTMYILKPQVTRLLYQYDFYALGLR